MYLRPGTGRSLTNKQIEDWKHLNFGVRSEDGDGREEVVDV